jgi:protease I
MELSVFYALVARVFFNTLLSTLFLFKHLNEQFMPQLKNLRVAILTENGFEQSELTSPKEAMEQAGVKVDIVSPQAKEVKAWDVDNWGISIPVDVTLDNAKPGDYDGLMLPGGVLNPDKLRMNPKAVNFVKHFLEEGKPLASICHGPQTLIETKMIQGKKMTSYPSVKTDLMNAGVNWVDEEVVVDNGLVTSRSPKDLNAFNKKLLEELAEGVHA